MSVAHRLPFLKSCLLAAACGVLLALSFPNFDFAPLAWLAPGLILLCATHSPKPFWISFCAGLAHYFISLYWLLLNPVRLYGIASWLSVCGILAGFMGLWCWLCGWVMPKPSEKGGKSSLPSILWPIFCAVLWVTVEMTVARFLTGFPWNLLATSQRQFLPFIQLASITGIYGVSFFMVWVSVSLVTGAAALFRKERSVQRAFLPLAVPGLLLIPVLIFGGQQLNKSSVSNAEPLTITMIQPAIPQTMIFDSTQETNRFRQIIDLSRQALEKTPSHILIWPEAALPRVMSRLNKDAVSAITQLATTHKVWIVLGATDIGLIRKDGNIQETNLLNSAFLVDPKGDLVARYFKRHLVPVGEFMPFREWIPKLQALRKSGRSITAGVNRMVFDLRRPDSSPIVRISPTICFEDVFPHVVRLPENEKADLIFNLTNDGWFGEGSAQWQQASAAAFRAIENGLPLVRCANNGITCWIDERGRWHETQFEDGRSIYASGFKQARIHLQPSLADHPTIYRRFGDWFGWSCFGIALLTGWVLRKSR